MRVAVVGASGFIGRAVADQLRADGHEALEIRGLRVSSPLNRTTGRPHVKAAVRDAVEQAVAGCHSVVNAAGDPDASSRDLSRLRDANALLPWLLADVVSCHSGVRLVHVSSAVVQGRAPRLTAAAASEAFSAYAQSKIEGEELVRTALPHRHVIYRPPSVHAPDRRVSRSIVRLAGSPLRSVATPASAPSPQALLENVASAVSYLATCVEQPPGIVIHPWEGVTTGGLMEVMGGRPPHVLPRLPAAAAVRLLAFAGRKSGWLAANARRVEMMWFGQAQEESWLSAVGWTPPVGADGWRRLRSAIVADQEGDATQRSGEIDMIATQGEST